MTNDAGEPEPVDHVLHVDGVHTFCGKPREEGSPILWGYNWNESNCFMCRLAVERAALRHRHSERTLTLLRLPYISNDFDD